MKKRIEHYILNEPWEERCERLAEVAERRIIRPFLIFAALYIGWTALVGFMSL
jgi:hypothetical protein